jgi:MFS family permease
MVVIDTTVTAVAVPAIVSDLRTALPAAQWATAGYLLGLVAVIPLAGWLSARFGARRVYLTALVAFTLFSLCAGLAWDVTSLAVFRVLQGLGGGLLNPVGQAIGLRAAPREARGRLMSLLVLPLIVGPVAGPLLAGWLIDAASWRWIFLVNIPLGLLATLVCAHTLPTDAPPADAPPADAPPADLPPADTAPPAAIVAPTAAVARRVWLRRAERARRSHNGPDWVGLVLLSGGAMLVVLGATMLDRPLGPAAAGYAGGLGLVAAGLGMLGGFVRRARRAAEPLVDLRLLRHRAVRDGTGVLVCFAAAYFGSMSLLPLFVQGVRGDPATTVGLLALPPAITVGVVAQVATRMVDRFPAHRIVLTGTALGAAGGAGLLAATVTDAGYPWIMAATVLLSAGSGATLMPGMTAALRDLDHAEMPRGTTLLALAVQLSSAVAGAVVAVTVSALVTARMAGAGGAVETAGAAGVDAADGGVAGMLALDPAARAALRPELATAVGGAYLLPVALLTLSFLLALRAGRQHRAAGGAGGGSTAASNAEISRRRESS